MIVLFESKIFMHCHILYHIKSYEKNIYFYCEINFESYRGELLWLTGRLVPYVVRTRYVNYLMNRNVGCIVKSHVEYIPRALKSALRWLMFDLKFGLIELTKE